VDRTMSDAGGGQADDGRQTRESKTALERQGGQGESSDAPPPERSSQEQQSGRRGTSVFG
jgi:hypothetical protein